MKKTLALLLALLLLCSLAACSNNAKNTPAPATDAPATNAPASIATEAGTSETAAPAEGTDKTDEGSAAPAPGGEDEGANEGSEAQPETAPAPAGQDEEIITITMGPDFYDTEATEEELKASALEEGFLDAKLNEDGTLTYTMTKARQQELLSELKESLEEGILELTDGEDAVPSFKRIEYADDLSGFDVYIDPEQFGDFDGFYALTLAFYGATYQAFSGNTDADSRVRFIDYQTDEEVDSVSYHDFLQAFSDLGSEDSGEYEWGGYDIDLEAPEMEETVVLDDGGVRVTALGITVDPYWGPGVNVRIENESEHPVYVECTRLDLNDYTVSGYLYAEVEPGAAAEDVLSFSAEQYTLSGITAIGSLRLQLRVIETEEYTELAKSELVEIRTSDYGGDLGTVPEGTVLYEANGVRITYLSFERDSFWDSSALGLLVENDSDLDVNLDCDKLLVNGAELHPWFYVTVPAGMKMADSITIADYELEDAGIEAVEDLAFAVSISNNDTWEEIDYTGLMDVDVSVG